ncbi:uroporphyrinogen-III synthase [Georgenia sp. Z1491]|uniref:uroporphyrinogen-III synthase n=1 Tax=Georgenia sp. Z1491 TaxID=3416707 RepID=UPI003CF5C860
MSLAGARVLVPAGSLEIARALREAGADVVPVTLTRTVELDVDPGAVDPAGAAWVLVTSARTVARLADVRLAGVRLDDGPRTWPAAVAAARADGTCIGSVGPATTAALTGVGITVDAEAPAGTAASLLDVVDRPGDPRRRRVLLPASALADPATARRLAGAGWSVDAVPVYTTVTAEPDEARAATRPWPDVVALTSPSTLRALLETAGRPPTSTALVAIGPTTATAIREAGLDVSSVAGAPTPEAIVAAVEEAAATDRARPDHAPTVTRPADPRSGVGPGGTAPPRRTP